MGSSFDVMIGDTRKPTLCIETTFSDQLILDFSSLLEKKYGFQTAHPDLQSLKDLGDLDVEEDEDDRNNSETDMALDQTDLAEGDNENDNDNDNDNENENDDDNENDIGNDSGADQTGGENADTANEAKAPGAKNKKVKKKEARYDLHDPFIDDSEMQWEEQAAATMDGFFVYMGPITSEQQNEEGEPDDKKKPAKRKGRQADPKSAKKRKSGDATAETTETPVKPAKTPKKATASETVADTPKKIASPPAAAKDEAAAVPASGSTEAVTTESAAIPETPVVTGSATR